MRHSSKFEQWSRRCILFLCLSLLAGTYQLAGAQGKGYRVTNSRITVNAPEHWQNWKMPTHAVELIQEGGVRPHFFRQRYNALDDLETFKRPIEALVIKKQQIAIENIGRTFLLGRDGNPRLDDQKKIGKYLDVDFQRFPGNPTYIVLNDQFYVITDTTMIAKKEVELTLKNVDTGALSTRQFATKDKELVPIYEYFVKPGISRVGSNPEDAIHILDGDLATYWEPDPNDPIENWWIEVDLGRTVPVDELVLKFVDEELGDPFRQFKVLIAPSQEPILQDAVDLDFVPVAGTKGPNLEQRLFSFPMEDNRDVAPGWTGRMVETIRIVVFDTKGRRHTRIEEADWLGLDASDQGDIVYFVKDLEGFEEPVSQEEYDNLLPERQGRKDYYRREHPRLAGIEVLGFGDNISPGIAQGGGSFDLQGAAYSPPLWAFDGDYSTWFLHSLRTPTLADRGVLTADLGATFWLDQVRVSAQVVPGQAEFFDGYIHRGSDGTRDARGRLKWVRLSPPGREDNLVTGYLQVLDEYSPASKVRFLETRITTTESLLTRDRGGAGIVEYQLYTRAYPAEVVVESDLIKLPSTRNFGRIFWEGETPPDTRLEVRTRSGDLLVKIIRFSDKSGKEISGKAWNKLIARFRGPVDTTFVPTSGWSPWSRIYQQSGERVTSPGLRKLVQIQVKMFTEDRDAAASIHSIDIELVNPVGARILAELWPAEIATPGLVDTFDVFLQPNFIENPVASRSIGFDEILLSMATGKSMELLELGLGVDSESGQAEQTFQPVEDVFVDQEGVELQVLRNRADSIWVRLPAELNILTEARRVYNRIMAEGEQVPVDREDLLLTAAGWGLLEEEEKGDVQYFRQRTNTSGEVVLNEVDHATYLDTTLLAEEERGPIRYFRILQGDGAQFPFDSNGDSLSASAYNSLPFTQKGAAIGPGSLVRLRFKAPVFRNGTTLQIDVRNTKGGTDSAAPWQSTDPGDATPLVAGNTLSISVPFDSGVLDDFAIVPNPFTPNGDGINDAAEIGFTVFKISAGREIAVRIYTLNGRRVWEALRVVPSGEESIRWDGTDAQGQLVPPGLYLCQIELDVDSQEQGGATRARLISVVY